ncbi:NADH dehydrogenase [ubiquinone] flavoprotein 3, mitochondrial [Apis laboriosa]|uniref:NADH dehydrogenase [ubiquinone] flavoprotein 3, mitochondrial n=1 Tax=Apis laboriosa TaxID=183418 RepID=UPI001CC73231|nr:NADH dehydrogenase [ubiquinone] flavoprotein 3, mitochondrial [Apis laboriosa]
MLRSTSNNVLKQRQNLIQYLNMQKSTKGKNNKSIIKPNVSGLSEKCCKVPSTPIGPNAAKNTEYKNPEYFCYHTETFGEAEVELAKYRLPAPSNKVPFHK